jgi:hypothetical protein
VVSADQPHEEGLDHTARRACCCACCCSSGLQRRNCSARGATDDVKHRPGTCRKRGALPARALSTDAPTFVRWPAGGLLSRCRAQCCATHRVRGQCVSGRPLVRPLLPHASEQRMQRRPGQGWAHRHGGVPTQALTWCCVWWIKVVVAKRYWFLRRDGDGWPQLLESV